MESLPTAGASGAGDHSDGAAAGGSGGSRAAMDAGGSPDDADAVADAGGTDAPAANIASTACDIPPSAAVGGYVPYLEAVSPAGRVAVGLSTTSLAVYKRAESGTTCQYVIDPDYGDKGTVTFRTEYFQTAWDFDERLYVTAQLGPASSVLDQRPEPGSIYRVTPRGDTRSCRYTSQSGGSTVDDKPDAFTVLPHGERLFVYWERTTEYQLNPSDPSFGDGTMPCNFAGGVADMQHFTSALSVSPAGLLFVRVIDGESRAVETDLDLNPLRTFGGSPFGDDGPGLYGVLRLSRCPVGYCAIDPRNSTIKLFGPTGAFLRAPKLAQEIGAAAFAASFLGPAKDGGAWLTGSWFDATGPRRHVVVRLAPAP